MVLKVKIYIEVYPAEKLLCFSRYLVIFICSLDYMVCVLFKSVGIDLKHISNSSMQNRVRHNLIEFCKIIKVQFTRDYTGQRSDGRYISRQIFHGIFKLSLVAAMVVIIKSTTRRLSSKDTFSQVSR